MQKFIPFCWRKDWPEPVTFLVTLAVFLLFGLCSCSSSKNLVKHHSETDSSSATHAIITQTVTERIDTNIVVAGSTVIATKAVDAILAGDSIFEETPTQVITTKVVKGRIKTISVIKPQVIPVIKIKSTVSKVQFDNKTRVEKDLSDKNVTREAKGINLNYLWLFLSAVIVFLLWKFGLLSRKKEEKTS